MRAGKGQKVLNRISFFERLCSGAAENESGFIFTEVRRKLTNNMYNSVDQFVDDVKRIIHDSRQLITDNDFARILCDHVLFVFEKACAKEFVYTTKSWTECVCKYRQKTIRLMVSGPRQVADHAEELTRKLAVQNENTQITEKELQNLAKATELLTMEEDHIEMIGIVKDSISESEKQLFPNMSATNIDMELTKLKPATIRKLQNFARTTLESRGIPYPQ